VTALVWFRRDLRLSENPAWVAATREHALVQAVFVLEPSLWEAAGVLRREHLAGHLTALDRSLRELGGALLVAEGPARSAVPRIGSRYDALYFNEDHSPYAEARDGAVRRQSAPEVLTFAGSLVHPPGSVLTAAGDPYRVFTPFYRRWRSLPLPAPAGEPGGAAIGDELELPVPEPEEFDEVRFGEKAAHERLGRFLDRVDDYELRRDRVDGVATSGLSADLKFGTISPVSVIRAVGDKTAGRASLVRQLAWRDFHVHALTAYPHGYTRALRSRYDRVEWRDDPDGLEAWRSGRTGFPIVDAAMRELAGTGRMHNRLRLLAASFLVKDLLVDWREGERHFRRLLIDADPAQNVGNWQWVAGTGFDAAPYFRVMNPTTQAKRHDPDGAYTRRWVTELSALEGASVHEPWRHRDLLRRAGVTLGEDYPLPIVDHAAARERALDAYRRVRPSS
jgi:deoxyribodipyrimidine photo-lyase